MEEPLSRQCVHAYIRKENTKETIKLYKKNKIVDRNITTIEENLCIPCNNPGNNVAQECLRIIYVYC